MSYSSRGVTLPDNLKESLDAYEKEGRPTGSFLTACIDNNLRDAIGRADDESLAALPAIVGYLYGEMDLRCWGRPGAASDWIQKKQSERQTGEMEIPT